jgi:hypothetical protein
MLLDQGVTLAASDHVAVCEEGERIGDHEPDRDGDVRDRVTDAGLKRALPDATAANPGPDGGVIA